nr:MAG TPA: hypothetical protein [Caudoviricetes sp.]
MQTTLYALMTVWAFVDGRRCAGWAKIFSLDGIEIIVFGDQMSGLADLCGFVVVL